MVSRSLRALLIGAAVLVVPLAFAAAPGCGSDAVGVGDCRQIEYVRCQLAPVCASYLTENSDAGPIVSTTADVANCKTFYRDQCLNGIENADASTSQDQDNACIAALNAAAACASAPTIAACRPGGVALPLADPSFGTEAPCNVLVFHPEDLAACNWVAWPDAGVPVTPTADADAGDASDAADAADGE